MATENYGIYGQLIESLASTPVSTDTTLIFIGACASGDLNRAYVITSMADYATTLGGAVGDGYNLTEAAIAAFQMVGLARVVMIPVSHSTTFSSSDYVGDGISTGASAIVRYLANEPKTVVLICAPSITDATALAAIKGACNKADGHWDSMMIYDTDIPNGAVNANGIFTDADAVSKTISDEQAVCCLGKIKTDGGDIVGLASVRACLMARSDANYGVPARSGGNLAIQGMTAWGLVRYAQELEAFNNCTLGEFNVLKDGNGDPISSHVDDESASMESADNPSVSFSKGPISLPYTSEYEGGSGQYYKIRVSINGYSGNGTVSVSGSITAYTSGDPVQKDISGEYVCTDGHFEISPNVVGINGYNADNLTITDGVDAWHASTAVTVTPFTVDLSYTGTELEFVPIDIPESKSTQLSANGICAVVNYSGTFFTWGDHTSAFSNGAVSDERSRFDNTIRMLMMILNRFQLKYRISVDSPMTLQMRNDVINEELDYLASLVAIGALIGEPTCEFAPVDNPQDSIAQGRFTWRVAATPTIPFKYGNLKVAYSQAGLSVYTA